MFWIIWGLLLALGLIGLVIDHFSRYWDTLWMPITAAVLAVCYGIFCFSYWICAKNNVKTYPTFVQTIEAQTETFGGEFINATVAENIIESNRVLAMYKYWNGTSFGVLIPDEVDDFEPIILKEK